MSVVTFPNGKTVTFDGTPTPADIDAVATKIGIQPSQSQAPQAPVDNAQSNATFPVAPTENPLAPTSILKGIGNIPSDAFNFVKGILGQPAKIASDISTIATPAAPGQVQVSPLDVIKNLPEGIGKTISSLVPDALKHLFTNPAQAGRDLENAPVSTVAPVVGGLEAGAEGLDSVTGLGDAAKLQVAKNAAISANTVEGPGFTMAPDAPQPVPSTFKQSLNNGLSTLTDPISSSFSKVGGLAGGAAATVIGKLVGLDPEAIKSVFTDPKQFSKDAITQNSDRSALAGDLGTAINTHLENLSSTGSGYDGIRQSGGTIAVPENFIPSVLQKYGFSINGDGKIIADSNSLTRNPTDINALQNFVDNWKDKATMTPNEFLNMRKDVTGIAKFGKDIGTNADAQTVARDIRVQMNNTMRPQVPYLKELDATYAPEKTATLAMQKEFFTKDGELKDSVANKVANATKSGREQVLARLENISPGITKRIEMLNTAEAIVKAQKGGLFREAVEGGIVGHFTGVLPGIITAIVTHPDFAIPMIRGLGLSAEQIGIVVNSLKTIGGQLSNHPVVTAQAAASDQNQNK
jgi:hypothetical protein